MWIGSDGTCYDLNSLEYLVQVRAGMSAPIRSPAIIPAADVLATEWDSCMGRDHLMEAIDSAIKRRDVPFLRRVADALDHSPEPLFQLPAFAVDVLVRACQGPVNVKALVRELMPQRRYSGKAESLEKHLRLVCREMGLKMLQAGRPGKPLT